MSFLFEQISFYLGEMLFMQLPYTVLEKHNFPFFYRWLWNSNIKCKLSFSQHM